MFDEKQRNADQEVNRRIAREIQPLHQQIGELNAKVTFLRDQVAAYKRKITEMCGTYHRFGVVVTVQNEPDPAAYEKEDEVIVLAQGPYKSRAGIILTPVDIHGLVHVRLSDGSEQSFPVASLGLTSKPDGRNAVLATPDGMVHVDALPIKKLNPGDTVLFGEHGVLGALDQINISADRVIATVLAVHETFVEVEERHDKLLVLNPKNLVVKSGNRVALDAGRLCLLSVLPEEAGNRYTLEEAPLLGWDELGGLLEVKEQLRDAIELPYKHPELFKRYHLSQDRGLLLYGPPGCGKTSLARACASAFAKMHGQTSIGSGFLYIKGPEILDKWVGNTELQIRNAFARMRKHYVDHGYKGILVIDEADALMHQRGLNTLSKIADTVVPMFCNEMDGLSPVDTERNPIVILMTNRPDILDPAVVRPGRISKHIKINRPDIDTSYHIVDLKLKDMPFDERHGREPILITALNDLFSEDRLLYKIDGEHKFTVGDVVTGALLEAIAERVKVSAMKREMETGEATGITLEDFRKAVQLTDQEQRGLNHSYDLQDFAERHSLQIEQMVIERSFASA